MTKPNCCKTGTAIFLLWVAMIGVGQAQVFTTLASFDGTDGADPWFMSLVQGRNGDFYGTTENAIFRVNPRDGRLTGVQGRGSYNGAILGADGNFYLVLNSAFYKVSPSGVETYLCGIPGLVYGGLLQASDGVFYGTAYGGGIHSDECGPIGCGFVFKVTTDCQFNTLYSFNGPDGSNPYSTLIETTNGTLWGTTAFGGEFGCGTVFRMTRAGALTILHTFSESDGCRPSAGLVQGNDGDFYGTTFYGLGGTGSVFRITPTGKLTPLACNHEVGLQPYGGALIQATDGNLYGTFLNGGLYDEGSIAQITPRGKMTAVHSFSEPDGAFPFGGLVQGTDGKIYGATRVGGDLTCNPPDGCGTVFSLDMGLGPFVTFVRPSGRVGQTGGILGQGFMGTTSITLNDLPVPFEVVSDTYIRATIPTGATSGYVTVTTPSGTLTSNKPFIVLP